MQLHLLLCAFTALQWAMCWTMSGNSALLQTEPRVTQPA